MIIANIPQKIQAVATIGKYRTWKRVSAFAINFCRQNGKQATILLLCSTEFQRNFYRFSLDMEYGVVKQAHFTGLQIVLQAILQIGYRLIATPKMYGLREKYLVRSTNDAQTSLFCEQGANTWQRMRTHWQPGYVRVQQLFIRSSAQWQRNFSALALHFGKAAFDLGGTTTKAHTAASWGAGKIRYAGEEGRVL